MSVFNNNEDAFRSTADNNGRKWQKVLFHMAGPARARDFYPDLPPAGRVNTVSEEELFGPEFLIGGPCSRRSRATEPVVLLIDEIDRADDEFEAFLLEIVSDFQISIPEIGTITATRKPAVVLTSNRTRELHDALKRRCLFHWIGHPTLEREIEIVQLRVPGVPERLAAQAAAFVQGLRAARPGEAAGGRRDDRLGTGARRARARRSSTPRSSSQTLGSVLKYHEDFEAVRDTALARLVEEARAVADRAVVRHVVTFGRVLREGGLEVGPQRIQDALVGLDRVELARRDDVYWTLGRRSSRAPRTWPRSTRRSRPGSSGPRSPRRPAGQAADRRARRSPSAEGGDEAAEAGHAAPVQGLEPGGDPPPEGLRVADAGRVRARRSG